MTLERRLVTLAGPDADRSLDRRDEHLAVADRAGPGGGRDRVDHLVDHSVRHDDLDPDLRQEVDGVLRAAVELRVALLSPEAPDLRHGHADDTHARERVLDLVELVRLDD